MVRYALAALLLRVVDAGATVGLVLLCTADPQIADPVRTAGILGAALTAPHLIGPLISPWVDRARDPRWVIGAAGIGYALLLGTAVLLLGRAPFLLVVLAVALAGCCGPMLTGGLSSLLPDLRTGTRPRRRSSFDALTYGVTASAGPAVVTVTAQFLDPTSALLILLGCAVVGSVATFTLPATRRSEAPAAAAGFREVVRTVWLRIPLRRLSVLTWLGAFGTAGLLLLGIARLNELSPGRGGWAAAAFGLGLLAGSLVLLVGAPRLAAGAGMRWSTAATVPLAVLVVLSATPAVLIGALAALGLVNAGQATFSLAGRAEYSSGETRGGVFMTVAGVKIAFSSAGTAAAGLLYGYGAPVLLATFAAPMLVAWGWAAFGRTPAGSVEVPSEEVDQTEDPDGDDGDGRQHQHHREQPAVAHARVGLGPGQVEGGHGDADQEHGVEDAGDHHQRQR